MTGHEKRVVVYCRESRDDGTRFSRIETQRDMLIDFCERQRLGRIVEIVLDDNKTGTDFARLEPLKEKARHKGFDILLCKDASRLGRSTLESLRFTEFLEMHGIALVFESERYDEDMFPLVAWFNERRAKDDSVKIRRVLRHKMEDGTLLIKAPYGYSKDKNRLVVNETTAPVVRMIFALFADGLTMGMIAETLNRRGYPTPSAALRGGAGSVWNRRHIERILKHIAYTGDMPYGKREKISYKSRRYRYKPHEDWIIIKNHHEPLVSRALFQRAQACLAQASVRRLSANAAFSGLVFCGRCGSRMVRKSRKDRATAYICGKNDREGRANRANATETNATEVAGAKGVTCVGCRPHRVSEMMLTQMTGAYVKHLTQTGLATASTSQLPENTAALLFERIIVYEPGEITPDCQTAYALTDDEYTLLLRDGGVLFLLNHINRCTFLV